MRIYSTKLKTLQVILLFFVFSFLFFGLTVSGVPALAVEGIVGRPASPDLEVPNSDTWFIYGLGPSEAREDGLIVQNTTSATARLLVYPADSTAAADGDFALKQQVEPMTSVGDWIRLYGAKAPEPDEAASTSFYTSPGDLETILGRCAPLTTSAGTLLEAVPDSVTSDLGIERSLSATESVYLEALLGWCQGTREQELTLEPGELALVPFVIRLPELVEVGEHTGGLVIEPLSLDGEAGAGSGPGLAERFGVRVYETVPGDLVKSLELSDFSVSFDKDRKTYLATVSLLNTGNVSVAANMQLKVTDAASEELVDTLSRQVQVLRGNTLISNFEWPRSSFGRYAFQAEVNFSDDTLEHTVSSAEITLLTVPWPLVIIGVVVILLILILIIYLIRNRRSRGRVSDWVRHRVKRGENLEDIAERLDMGWKRIARVNALAKPYTLADGQVILVPPKSKSAKSVRPVKAAKSVNKAKAIKAGTGEVSQLKPPVRPAMKPGLSRLQPSAPQPGIKWTRIIVGALILVILAIILLIPRNNFEEPLDLRQPIELEEAILEETARQHSDENVGELDGPATMPEGFGREVAESEPEVQVKPEDITVAIQNGSGVSGAAGRLSAQLLEAGYNIDSTGNADNFDYTSTLLRYSAGAEPQAELLQNLLEELGFTVEAEVAESESDALTVIIGKE